jgi:hypothetical protein
MLGPSWNAPIGALPHDDRAGTHDSADGHCGSYASIGRGQVALLWITLKVENVCKDKAGALSPGSWLDSMRRISACCARAASGHPAAEQCDEVAALHSVISPVTQTKDSTALLRCESFNLAYVRVGSTTEVMRTLA